MVVHDPKLFPPFQEPEKSDSRLCQACCPLHSPLQVHPEETGSCRPNPEVTSRRILDPSWCWAWHNLHMLSLDSQKDFTCDQQLGKYLNKLLALRSAKKLLSI